MICSCTIVTVVKFDYHPALNIVFVTEPEKTCLIYAMHTCSYYGMHLLFCSYALFKITFIEFLMRCCTCEVMSVTILSIDTKLFHFKFSKLG